MTPGLCMACVGSGAAWVNLQCVLHGVALVASVSPIRHTHTHTHTHKHTFWIVFRSPYGVTKKFRFKNTLVQLAVVVFLHICMVRCVVFVC